MSYVHAIGIAAATLTTISFLPQVWRSWKTRDTRSLSLTMYMVFSVGTGLWLIYGYMVQDWPVMAANAIVFALSLTVLTLKFRYG